MVAIALSTHSPCHPVYGLKMYDFVIDKCLDFVIDKCLDFVIDKCLDFVIDKCLDFVIDKCLGTQWLYSNVLYMTSELRFSGSQRCMDFD
jgi:hypothetical protein